MTVYQFKFKLEGLLKIRKLKEDQLKIELGMILKEIEEVHQKIKKINKDIDTGYESHEKLLFHGTGGKLIQFFPEFFQAKREDINNKENLLHALQRKAERKKLELNLSRGEVKVVEKLREKKEVEFKKKKNKRDEEKIEDLIRMRR